MESESKTTLAVIGSASVVRQSDIAYITLYVFANGILMEDAVKQAGNKIKLINETLKDTFPDIRETRLKDIFVGESKSYSYAGRDKGEPPQPEVIKGLLIIAPPNADLATKIIDTASRMGCIIQNPVDSYYGPYPKSVVLYGLVNYAEAEQEAMEQAVNDAKHNASNAARIINKQVSSIQEISSVETLRMKLTQDETMRLDRNAIVFPTSYLSVSPETVEVSVRVSVKFELANNPK
jgi:uncharacterized protein YggE